MQFDLDLVFQINNIEMWNKFPLNNGPQKYNSLIQRSPYSLQQWTNVHTAQQSACAPRQGKNECEYTKTTRKYPREDFIDKKRQKLETDKQKLWQNVPRVRQAHLKDAGLHQFYERSAPL
jgi:hypothetical protein